MESKVQISCTHEWRGHTTRSQNSRVTTKWARALSSLQGISNLLNILFHKLQCRKVGKSLNKVNISFSITSHFDICIQSSVMGHVGKLSDIITQRSPLILFHLVNWVWLPFLISSPSTYPHQSRAYLRKCAGVSLFIFADKKGTVRYEKFHLYVMIPLINDLRVLDPATEINGASGE